MILVTARYRNFVGATARFRRYMSRLTIDVTTVLVSSSTGGCGDTNCEMDRALLSVSQSKLHRVCPPFKPSQQLSLSSPAQPEALPQRAILQVAEGEVQPSELVQHFATELHQILFLWSSAT